MLVQSNIQLNSKIIVATVRKNTFNGTPVEVERVAEEIGIYGQVKDYAVNKIGNTYNISFRV